MIRLISDSTSDLSPALRERAAVEILPLGVVLDETEYTDGVDITPEELYAWSDRTKQTPKTAVFSLDAAKARFRPLLDAGDELICFSISESMSASGQVMRLAAQQLHAADRVHVVDSQSLSTGIGLLILRAAERVAEGRSAAEILEELERLKPLVRASFVVDTMTYLHRGGRCGSVAMIMATTLRIHPRIVVKDGSMQADRKYRGRMQHVLEQYVDDLLPDLRHASPERVFITHSGCPAEWVEEIRRKLEALHIFGEVLETRAGSVISSHCGPNTLGVLFIAAE